MLYDYINNDLQKDIAFRTSNKSRLPYTEAELWYLLTAVSSALCFLKSKDIHHGDVRPYTILITTDGRAKLSENFQYSNPLSAYTQLLTGLREEAYISPELFAGLLHRDQNPRVDLDRSDVYSLAMTVLEAATLTSTAGVYNFETYRINQDVLDRLLNELSGHYSGRLVQLLRAMLSPTEDQRLFVQQVLSECDSRNSQTLDVVNRLTWGVSVPQQQVVYEESRQEVARQAHVPVQDNYVDVKRSYIQEPQYVQQPVTLAQDNYVPIGSYTSSYVPSTTTTYVSDYKPIDLPPIEQRYFPGQTTTIEYNTDLDARIMKALSNSQATFDLYGKNQPITTTSNTLVDGGRYQNLTPVSYELPVSYSTTQSYTDNVRKSNVFVPIETKSTNYVPLDPKLVSYDNYTPQSFAPTSYTTRQSVLPPTNVTPSYTRTSNILNNEIANSLRKSLNKTNEVKPVDYLSSMYTNQISNVGANSFGGIGTGGYTSNLGAGSFGTGGYVSSLGQNAGSNFGQGLGSSGSGLRASQIGKQDSGAGNVARQLIGEN